jgi:tetratricopeptide (TPR) repeat protein
LGSAYVNWSKYEEAGAHLERGLALANHSLPASAIRGTFALLMQVIRQIWMRLRISPSGAVNDKDRNTLLELTRAYEGLMEIYYITDKPVPCLYSVFRGLNLCEAAGASPELARCYSSTAAVLGFMAMRKYANAYFQRAALAAEQAADPTAQAWVSMTKGVYFAGLGERDAARENLLHSIEIYDRLGDSRRADDARANLAASCYLHSGFAESLQLAERIYKTSLVRRDLRAQAEATRWRAYNLIALGRLNEGQAAIAELDALRSSTLKLGGFHRKQDVATLSGLLQLYRGDRDGALQSAMNALELMRSQSDSFEFLLERTGIAEVLLTTWEVSGSPNSALRSAAAKAVKGIGKYSRIFPIGKPANLLYGGRLKRLQGNNSKALEMWQQCLGMAGSLDMPFYEGLAGFALASHLPESDPEREAHLTAAKEVFERLGAACHASQINNLANS